MSLATRFGIPFALTLAAACGGTTTDDPTPAAPSAFEVVAGANQQATVNSTTPVAPSVKLKDANGRALSNAIVKFTVQSGGGVLTGDSVRTNASGVAAVGSWKLGPTIGMNVLRATAFGTNVSTVVNATATAGPATVLAAITSQQNAALVGGDVTPLPTVEVRDAFGNALAGETVTFTASFGGGSVTGGTQVTDAAGRATVGSWTLGPAAGLNRLTARAGANASFIFEAQGLASPPSIAAAASPTVQTAFLRAMVPKIPRVVVTDAFGNPSPGIAVTFRIVGGGDAVLTGGTVFTGGDGVAAPGDWRLGLNPSSSVEAVITGFPPITFQATGTAAPFLIDVRFLSPLIPDDRDAFAAAATRWMGIITADVPDVPVNAAAGGACDWAIPTPAINETIDDVVIYAIMTTIDGPGGILGGAGPCIERNSSHLTSVGGMQFEFVDLSTLRVTNRLVPVITHEMGHVLGLYKFRYSDLGLITDLGSPDPIFTGAGVMGIWPTFAIAYAGRLVPLHNADGQGSADSHWRESVLGDELMTPFVAAAGVPMPLSRLTIAALDDIGYTVDLSKADPFLANLRAPSMMSLLYPAFRLDEVIHRAKHTVDTRGKLTPVN